MALNGYIRIGKPDSDRGLPHSFSESKSHAFGLLLYPDFLSQSRMMRLETHLESCLWLWTIAAGHSTAWPLNVQMKRFVFFPLSRHDGIGVPGHGARITHQEKLQCLF
jgi:hypothetical protein